MIISSTDLFGLIEHLNIGRAFLIGLSFGSTIVLGQLHREPRRFPKAIVQGVCIADLPGLNGGAGLCRRLPGTRQAPLHAGGPLLQQQEPLSFDHRRPLALLSRAERPHADRGKRIGSTWSRGSTCGRFSPRFAIPVLLLQATRTGSWSAYFDELNAALPAAEGVIMPLVGHQPHCTHAEALAQVTAEWLLPCAADGCPTSRNRPQGRESSGLRQGERRPIYPGGPLRLTMRRSTAWRSSRATGIFPIVEDVDLVRSSLETVIVGIGDDGLAG